MTTGNQILIIIPMRTSHLKILKLVVGTQNMNKMMKVLKQRKKAVAKKRRALLKKENKNSQKITRDTIKASTYLEESTKFEKNHQESVSKTQSQKRMKMILKIDKIKQKVKHPLQNDLKSRRRTNVLLVGKEIELKKNLMKVQKNNW